MNVFSSEIVSHMSSIITSVAALKREERRGMAKKAKQSRAMAKKAKQSRAKLLALLLACHAACDTELASND